MSEIIFVTLHSAVSALRTAVTLRMEQHVHMYLLANGVVTVANHTRRPLARVQQEPGVEDDPSTRARRVYHMGNLLQKRGEVKEAAKMYRSAVKLDPAHKASHYNLGGFCSILVRLHYKAFGGLRRRANLSASPKPRCREERCVGTGNLLLLLSTDIVP